jgi:hypothetical protein
MPLRPVVPIAFDSLGELPQTPADFARLAPGQTFVHAPTGDIYTVKVDPVTFQRSLTNSTERRGMKGDPGSGGGAGLPPDPPSGSGLLMYIPGTGHVWYDPETLLAGYVAKPAGTASALLVRDTPNATWGALNVDPATMAAGWVPTLVTLNGPGGPTLYVQWRPALTDAGLYLVGPDPARYPYATIGDALAVATAPAVVLVAPGTYAEDVTLVDGVRIVGAATGDPSATVVQGTVTVGAGDEHALGYLRVLGLVDVVEDCTLRLDHVYATAASNAQPATIHVGGAVSFATIYADDCKLNSDLTNAIPVVLGDVGWTSFYTRRTTVTSLYAVDINGDAKFSACDVTGQTTLRGVGGSEVHGGSFSANGSGTAAFVLVGGATLFLDGDPQCNSNGPYAVAGTGTVNVVSATWTPTRKMAPGITVTYDTGGYDLRGRVTGVYAGAGPYDYTGASDLREVLAIDTQGTDASVLLPDVTKLVPGSGPYYIAKHVSTTGTVTLTPLGTQTIRGTNTPYVLAAGALHGVQLVPTHNSGWLVVGAF